MKTFTFLGAIFCFTGVLAGALSAHPLKNYLVKMDGLYLFTLATDYMFYHGIALILLGVAQDRFRTLPFHHAGWLLVAGTFLFQGNLYLRSLTGEGVFSMFTPIGGICLLIGWLLFALHVLRIRTS